MTKDQDKGAIQEILYYRCRDDFETFCKIFFSHYCKYEFNKFHKDTFKFYSENVRGLRQSDAAPRGYAKSTIKTLFKPLHDLCYGLENFILIISDTQSLANSKLKDIRNEILCNGLLRFVYGMRFPTRAPGAEYYIVINGKREMFVQGIGAGTSVRGIRFRESRPTKIILDDVENSDDVENPELRQKLLDWYNDVVTNLGTNNTCIEVVGTILHKQSLLKQLEANPVYKARTYKAVISWAHDQKLWEEWRKLFTNLDDPNRESTALDFYNAHEKAMLEGTEVLWPEKEPYLYLMKEIVEKGKRSFFKEKQNEPLASGETLFDRIHWYHESDEGLVIESNGVVVPWDEVEGRYGALDPATGQGKDKTKIDFTCLLGGLKDFKGRLFVHKDWTRRAKPTIYIGQIFEMHEILKFEKIVVETNLYKNLLMENLARERKDRESARKKAGVAGWGLKLPFYEIENRDKKEKRIFTLEPKISNGYILFNRTLSMEFMDQIESFPKHDHDDAPDALEMLWGLINNRYKPSPINADIGEI